MLPTEEQMELLQHPMAQSSKDEAFQVPKVQKVHKAAKRAFDLQLQWALEESIIMALAAQVEGLNLRIPGNAEMETAETNLGKLRLRTD